MPLGLFRGRLDEVFIELARNLIQPSPILGDRLQYDGAAMTPNANLVSSKTKILGKPHGLGSSRPENLRSLHSVLPTPPRGATRHRRICVITLSVTGVPERTLSRPRLSAGITSAAVSTFSP
jgi:hypothetical protein